MLLHTLTLTTAAALASSVFAEPVNAMCPIGKEPVVPAAGTVEHNGQTIGLCCPGCGKAFLAWDEVRKDAFVANATASATPLHLGVVRQHGQIREVMREGDSAPRVALSEFAGRDNVIAVGALSGLAGEIVVIGGETWTSHVQGSDVVTTKNADKHATLLTVAQVDAWKDSTINADGLTLDDLLTQEIKSDEPTPFVIESDAAALDLHVINGHCPMGADPKDHDAEPWRWSGTVSSGVTLVGFHAPGTAGVMTHHGTNAHAHSLVEINGERIAAHVDAARFLGAAVLATPQNADAPSAPESRPDRAVVVEDDASIEDQLLHYPLENCLVSGAPLGSMGDPINMLVDGRLVKLCCAGCIGTIKNDPDAATAKLDEKITERQLDRYPLDTCVISGAKLGSMGEPVNVFHNNRLARLCCAGCLDAFHANPEDAMAKLDAAYADAQRDGYPLDTCVVSGAKLGSMGDPVELVAGTKLARFCCASCLPAFKQDPEKFLAKLPRE